MRSKGIVSILAIVLVFSMAIVMFSSVIYAREEGSFCRAQLAACLRGCGADAGCATACHAEFRACINGISTARLNDRVQLYPSSALVTLKLNDHGTGNAYLRGITNVVFEDIGDSDNDTKLDIPIEIVQMHLTGTSKMGNVTIRLNNNTQTKGLVETKKNNTVNNTNKTYPATSFFDVFVEIELSGKFTNSTNTTNSTNNTGGRHGHGNPPNNGLGSGTINSPRIQGNIPAMKLFNKNSLPIMANSVLNGNKTSVHGYYRPLVYTIDLYDVNNPDGLPVGSLKIVMLNLRK